MAKPNVSDWPSVESPRPNSKSSAQGRGRGRGGGGRGKAANLGLSFRWDAKHAWSSQPGLYLAVVAKAKPSTVVASQLGLRLLALASELKALSATMLSLVAENQEASAAVCSGAALQTTLRTALRYCCKVHREEVLPAARFFAARSGGGVEAWEQAVDHMGDSKELVLVGPADGDVDALPSSAQRALLRCLASAAEMGAPKIKESQESLAVGFIACERFRRCLATKLPREGDATCMSWERGLLRRHTETGTARFPGGYKQVCSDATPCRLPLCPACGERFPGGHAGPELVAHGQEIAALVSPDSPSYLALHQHSGANQGTAFDVQQSNCVRVGSHRPSSSRAAESPGRCGSPLVPVLLEQSGQRTGLVGGAPPRSARIAFARDMTRHGEPIWSARAPPELHKRPSSAPSPWRPSPPKGGRSPALGRPLGSTIGSIRKKPSVEVLQQACTERRKLLQ